MRKATPHSDQVFLELAEKACDFGVHLTDAQMSQLGRFCRALAAYNASVNLVAKADLPTILFDHVLDSLSLVPVIERSGALSLVDIGSGAGFPGLVLAIACPDLRVTLLESIGKKARFLRETVGLLDLSGRTEILCERAEVAAHKEPWRGSFDLATARAVGTLKVVAELSLPFLRQGGSLLAQKSSVQLQVELPQASDLLRKLGGGQVQMERVSSTGKDLCVVVVPKEAQTPDKYPRPASAIMREKKRDKGKFR